MKTLKITLAFALLGAGSAFAQGGPPPGFDELDAPLPQPPMRHQFADGMHRTRPSPHHQESGMRGEIKAIRDLAASIRAEGDEAKKAEFTAQLREELGKSIDRMNEHHAERLAKMEEELAQRTEQVQERITDLKARLEKFTTDRDALIDEQLQTLLDGKPWPPRPGRMEGEEPRWEKRGEKRGGRGGRPAPPPPPEAGWE